MKEYNINNTLDVETREDILLRERKIKDRLAEEKRQQQAADRLLQRKKERFVVRNKKTGKVLRMYDNRNIYMVDYDTAKYAKYILNLNPVGYGFEKDDRFEVYDTIKQKPKRNFDDFTDWLGDIHSNKDRLIKIPLIILFLAIALGIIGLVIWAFFELSFIAFLIIGMIIWGIVAIFK